MADTATVLEVGARVGETYEVVRLIGRGGMGEVWLARHLRLAGKQVAIKVLHTRVGGLSSEALVRFKREADIATSIGHPNIVEVHDYNTLPSGAPYLVLEFLQGESLASRLRFGAMSVEEVMPIIRQVGSALDASHQRGVVHRDLKPDNIFLVPTPMGTHVKVLDFGISKVIDSDTVQTKDDMLVGTPQYMSPEQATGQNKDVGPQTDVFALGSIAYEMLSGQPAFSADSIAKIVFRIAYEPHVPLQQVKPGLEPRVYAAISRALEKDRAKRFDSIAAFIADLTGQPVPRTVPPQQSGELSGVARPGMATPDSLALGKTSAHTPAPVVMPSSPPAVTPAPTPARTSPLLFVGLALAAVIGAGVVWLVTKPPPMPVAQPMPPPPPPPPPPMAEVKPAPPQVEPTPTAPEQPVAPRPAPVVKKVSEADQKVLDEMEQRLKGKDALMRVRQLLGSLTSEAGLQRAYVIAAIAACKEHDLGNVRQYLDRVTERAGRQRLIAECKKLGMDVVE